MLYEEWMGRDLNKNSSLRLHLCLITLTKAIITKNI